MELKLSEKTVKELLAARANFAGSDSAYAKSIGINSAQYSRISNGDLVQVISDAKWYSLARMLNVQMHDRPEWKVAQTPVFSFVTSQLEMCQQSSISLMLCDLADIGKTFTAKVYAKTHKNAVYIDCSQSKTKQKLIRVIARSFGVTYTGRYNDVYEDLVFYLKSQSIAPMVILDEAGDLNYEAFLELKALWNATEGACAWFMIGADGLKEKMRRSIDCKKVGYTEMFSRFGSKYQRVTPEASDDRERFNAAQAAAIIQANAPEGANVDINKMIARCGNSLRRIYIELTKLQQNNG